MRCSDKYLLYLLNAVKTINLLSRKMTLAESPSSNGTVRTEIRNNNQLRCALLFLLILKSKRQEGKNLISLIQKI